MYFFPILTLFFFLDVAEQEVVIMFSCRIKKWNKYGIKQERNFIVTNLNVYNFK